MDKIKHGFWRHFPPPKTAPRAACPRPLNYGSERRLTIQRFRSWDLLSKPSNVLSARWVKGGRFFSVFEVKFQLNGPNQSETVFVVWVYYLEGILTQPCPSDIRILTWAGLFSTPVFHPWGKELPNIVAAAVMTSVSVTRPWNKSKVNQTSASQR